MVIEVTARTVTVEEYAELPDDGTLHELVRGEVVTLPHPGYEHGYLTASIGTSLFQHVRERDLGEVVAGDPGFVLAESSSTDGSGHRRGAEREADSSGAVMGKRAAKMSDPHGASSSPSS